MSWRPHRTDIPQSSTLFLFSKDRNRGGVHMDVISIGNVKGWSGFRLSVKEMSVQGLGGASVTAG
jgi:hypothetical protein